MEAPKPMEDISSEKPKENKVEEKKKEKDIYAGNFNIFLMF